MPAVKTGQVLKEKEVHDFTFYPDQSQMLEIAMIAKIEGISIDDALITYFARYVNDQPYAQFSLERVKRQNPEIANLRPTVEVTQVGKVTVSELDRLRCWSC
jgi:hypothetical protein